MGQVYTWCAFWLIITDCFQCEHTWWFVFTPAFFRTTFLTWVGSRVHQSKQKKTACTPSQGENKKKKIKHVWKYWTTETKWRFFLEFCLLGVRIALSSCLGWLIEQNCRVVPPPRTYLPLGRMWVGGWGNRALVISWTTYWYSEYIYIPSWQNICLALSDGNTIAGYSLALIPAWIQACGSIDAEQHDIAMTLQQLASCINSIGVRVMCFTRLWYHFIS